MMDFLYQLNWTELIIFALTTIGGGLIVWYRKRIATWKQFWRGVLEGLRGIPALQEDVKGISSFVRPNGGGSLMDAVSSVTESVKTLTEQVDLVISTIVVENDTDDSMGRFYCDDKGQNTYVNQQYARWLGVGKAELLGFGWISFIHTEDVERVRKHWEVCRKEHRQFRADCRLVATNGDTFEVSMIATPIPDKSPAKRWIGSVRRIESGYNTVAQDPDTPKTPVLPH